SEVKAQEARAERLIAETARKREELRDLKEKRGSIQRKISSLEGRIEREEAGIAQDATRGVEGARAYLEERSALMARWAAYAKDENTFEFKLPDEADQKRQCDEDIAHLKSKETALAELKDALESRRKHRDDLVSEKSNQERALSK